MIRLTTCALILVAAGGAPWLLGGRTPWCDALVPLVTLVAAIIWLLTRTERGVSTWSRSALGVAALLTGFVWLQTVPLPASLFRNVTSKDRIERIDQLLTTTAACDQEEAASPVADQPIAWNQISSDPLETHRRWATLATALAIGIIAMSLASDELIRLAMVFALAINGAAFGVLALFMRASSPGLIYWSIKPQWPGQPFGAFVNRNHAGLFLALSGLCALFGICLLLSQRIAPRLPSLNEDDLGASRRRTVSLTDLRMIWLSQKDSVLFFFAFCALFCAVSSIVAASRSGFLAFGAVIVVAALMLFLAGADRRLILAIGVLGGIAAIVSGTKFESLMNRFDTEAVESGWVGRYEHWSDILAQANEFAFTGTGYGTYAYATLPYVSNVNSAWFKNADNQFVEWFVELGAVGAMFIVAFMALFGVRCAMLIRSPELQSKIVGLFGCGLLAIASINGMGDFALAVPGVILPMALAAGFVLGYRPQDESKTRSSKLSLSLMLGMKLAVVATVSCAAFIGVSHLATSQKEMSREQDPVQWVARSVSQSVREPSLTALTNDATEAIAQFVAKPQELIESIAPDAFPEDGYSLENLAMFRRALGAEKLDDEFQDLREALRAFAPLQEAEKDYVAASRLAPMRFENHLALAKLGLILCPGPSVTERIAKVRLIHPMGGVDSARAGLVSIINGDLELGGEQLGQALRQERQLETNIFAVLKSELTVQQVAKHVLKQDAALLILAADRYYNGKNEWFARNFLYAQLRSALETGHSEGLTESQAKYYLAKTKRMVGDHESAFADFETACEDWNSPSEWHSELASYYTEEGEFRKAKNVLMRMQNNFGYDANREKQIEALEKQNRGASSLSK